MIDTAAHTFALYIPEFSQVPATCVVRDEALVRRMAHVLRLAVGEHIILFDQQTHGLAEIHKIDKKYIECVIKDKQANKILQPAITLALPILKREAFEQAIYGATELGATSIQPLITAKIHRDMNIQKEYERLKRIIIAAAEQSKHYALPELREPLSLEEYLVSLSENDAKIFCDPQGIKVHEVIKSLTPTHSIILIIGPEGDLTLEEKALLRNNNFLFCALTPTILRAQQAVVVALGILRSTI